MHIVARSISLPKAGNSVSEYEDACWPVAANEMNAKKFKCAVADGATESSFADTWARMLAQSYAEGRLTAESIIEDLQSLQVSMSEQIGLKTLPWYAAEKAEKGAFSTLLGLTIAEESSKEPIVWLATAIGDSCLFQLRGDELIEAFPLNSAEQFLNRPVLMPSNASLSDGALQALDSAEGSVKPGDEFFLMTDALAYWFLSATGNSERPWQTLREFIRSDNDEDFEAWITELRSESLMRNDDVTLLHVQINR